MPTRARRLQLAALEFTILIAREGSIAIDREEAPRHNFGGGRTQNSARSTTQSISSPPSGENAEFACEEMKLDARVVVVHPPI
jgi:hypothetical protein